VPVVVKKDLKNLKQLIPKIRKTYVRKVRSGIGNQIIKKNISKGLSPVKGKGRFQKYSDSYKETIKGNVSFRKIKGKVVPLPFPDASVFGLKKLTPVNLKLSGQMLSTFFTKVIKDSLLIGFRDPLSEIHDQKGAGASQVKRRMLPTEPGEEFKPSISRWIRNQLEKAVREVLART